MSLLSTTLFTKSDFTRVADAIHEAEKKTSGEIVPYVVEQSDGYEESEWRTGLLLGVLALAIIVTIHQLSTMWLPIDVGVAAFVILAASLTGALLVKYVPALKRLMTGHTRMEHRVAQRAAQAFLQEEVFNTSGRTGILLFVSLLERMVLVLGDSGINAKVQQSEWDDVVRIITDGMKEDKPAEALVNAIGRCGELLQKEGVVIRPDDKDELRDDLRLRAR